MTTSAFVARHSAWLAIMIVLVATIFGGAIRSHELATAPYVDDEYFTAAHYDTRRSRLVNPAYYQLANISVGVLGENELGFRIPAFLLGVFSIPLLFYCFRRYFGDTAAVFAALLLSINSWHLYHSQNARFYTGIAFLGILVLLFYLEAIRRGRISFLLWHVLAGIAAVFFHATAAVFVGAFWFVSAAFSFAPGYFGVTAEGRRIATIHFWIGVAAAIIAVPVALLMLNEWNSLDQSWGRAGIALVMQTVNKLNPLVCIAAAGGLWLAWSNNKAVAVTLLVVSATTLVVFLALSFFVPVRPDYFISIAPIVFALAGYYCAMVVGEKRVVHQVLVFLILFGALLPSAVSHVTHRSSHSVKSIIAFIEREFQAGDDLVTMVPGFRHYSTIERSAIEVFPASAYDDSYDWRALMARHSTVAGRTWVVVPIRRRDISARLFSQLGCLGQLVWREKAIRYDYSDFGAEVYLINWEAASDRGCLPEG